MNDGIHVAFAARDELARNEARWRRLMKEADNPQPFLDPDFALAYLAHVETGRQSGALVISAGERWIGLLPVDLGGWRKGLPLTAILGWNTAFAPLFLPLFARDAMAEASAALIRFMAGQRSVAAWLLPMVDETAATNRMIRDMLIKAGHRLERQQAHQRAALHVPDIRWCALPAKKHKELRRLQRRLGEQGPVTVASTESGLDGERAFTAFLQLERDSWKGGQGTALLQQSAQLAFYRMMLERMLMRGQAAVHLLQSGDRPVAAGITLKAGRRMAFHKIAYDPDFAAFSPGVQLTLAISERVLAGADARIMDSCAIAGHPMIESIWRGRITIADWMVSARPAGGVGFALAHLLLKARAGAIALFRCARAALGG